jgi:hypothetical protein
MARNTRNTRWIAWAGVVCGLVLSLSCSKVAELGEKLKAPEAEWVVTPVAGEEDELTIIPPPPEPEGPQINVDAEVSILGYHDFSRTRPATEMVIHPDNFRKQMEMLKASGVTVI